MDKEKRAIAILGSTGSIGTQALEIVREHSERFEIYALTANNNIKLLIEQAIEFKPEVVVISNESLYTDLKDALSKYPIKVWAGQDAICQVVQSTPIDIVLTAMVGYAGLKPTISAIKAKKMIALANKETLVVAGELIINLAKEYKAPIIPVDSEHSAIFQCLVGENSKIEKILLTASGGPFRNYTKEQLLNVDFRQALKHPNWSMGAKVTIDSASLMNKGFEMMEAKWFFDVEPKDIEVVVHPESVIHSMVQFEDTSVKAQLSSPSMKLPIQYALTFPERLTCAIPKVNFFELQSLHFEKPNLSVFRNLDFAYQAIQKGGNMPCILNASNEIVVSAFLNEKIGFLQMSDIIEKTMNSIALIEKPNYEDYVQTNIEARLFADELVTKNYKY